MKLCFTLDRSPSMSALRPILQSKGNQFPPPRHFTHIGGLDCDCLDPIRKLHTHRVPARTKHPGWRVDSGSRGGGGRAGPGRDADFMPSRVGLYPGAWSQYDTPPALPSTPPGDTCPHLRPAGCLAATSSLDLDFLDLTSSKPVWTGKPTPAFTGLERSTGYDAPSPTLWGEMRLTGVPRWLDHLV